MLTFWTITSCVCLVLSSIKPTAAFGATFGAACAGIGCLAAGVFIVEQVQGFEPWVVVALTGAISTVIGALRAE